MRLVVRPDRPRGRFVTAVESVWRDLSLYSAVSVILLVGACRASTPRPLKSVTDPRALAGRWNLELGEGYLLPFGPGVLGGRREPFIVGDLWLDSVVVAVDVDGSSMPGVSGKLIRSLSEGDEPPPIEYPAAAAFRADGQVVVSFKPPARAYCPCPLYELVGPLEDGEIRGRSSIVFGEHTSRGRFILRRGGT